MTNRGLHITDGMDYGSYQDIKSVWNSSRQITNCSLWKTTTPSLVSHYQHWQHEKKVKVEAGRQVYGDMLVDAWAVVDRNGFDTAEYMWDHLHFTSNVYNVLNEELMRVLAKVCSPDGEYSMAEK